MTPRVLLLRENSVAHYCRSRVARGTTSEQHAAAVLIVQPPDCEQKPEFAHQVCPDLTPTTHCGINADYLCGAGARPVVS